MMQTRFSSRQASQTFNGHNVTNLLDRKKKLERSYLRTEQEEAFKEMIKVIGANGGRVRYGEVDRIVKAYQEAGCKGVTWANLYYRLSQMKKKTIIGTSLEFRIESQGIISELSGNTFSDSPPDSPYDPNNPDHIPPTPESNLSPQKEANVGGRSKGSTKVAKLKYQQETKNIVTSCSKRYWAEREKATKLGRKVAAGTLKRIVNEETKNANLPINVISQETILSRIKRRNPEAINFQQVSPIHELEPMIAEFCIRLARMGHPLTRETVIALANDLIKETDYNKKVSMFKEVRKLKNIETLGAAWYRGFMSRNATKLTRKGANIKDTKRSTWVRKENFENMYNCVYENMVEAGVAVKMDEAVDHGDGLRTHYALTKPEFVLFVDETGSNTNQLKDGRVGGEQFILPKEDAGQCGPIGATTDIHFTVLPFLSATGQAVMCAVIFKSDLDISKIPVSWKTGIDITVGNVYDIKQVMKGGPTCTYLGKKIPCFYGASPNASITAELLVSMIKFMDELNVFDRTIAKPFLLLDGHHSRMSLHFLRYVNDPAHRWLVCFGVPYATHVWQPNDAEGLNGKFKLELTRAKKKYLLARGSPKFEPTDIIPLVNTAFQASFANEKSVKRAIARRGWNPLNYKLLEIFVNPRGNETISSETPCTIVTPSLNAFHGSASTYMDPLVEEAKKDAGRKRRNEELKAALATKEQKLHHLKTMGKVSSARLAANNHYVLDENVLECLEEIEKTAESAKAKSKQKQRELENKRRQALESSLKKLQFTPNTLTVPDMKALVTAVQGPDDSPVQQKKAGLTRQLYCEARYAKLQRMLDEFRPSTHTEAEAEPGVYHADAAEALVALGAHGPIIPM